MGCPSSPAWLPRAQRGVQLQHSFRQLHLDPLSLQVELLCEALHEGNHELPTVIVFDDQQRGRARPKIHIHNLAKFGVGVHHQAPQQIAHVAGAFFQFGTLGGGNLNL